MSTELRFGLEWELWVLDKLLLSEATEADVIETLVAQGVDEEAAEFGVHTLVESKRFDGLRQRIQRALMAERIERLQSELARGDRDHIPVRADIDRQALYHEHWAGSWPVHLTECAKEMHAVKTWSLDHLGQRLGDLKVEVNSDRLLATDARDTESRSTDMAFREFATRAQRESSNDFYIVSRNGLFSRPELETLWEDLAPLPEILVAPKFPQGVSLWLGPAGTTTPPHFDPHNVLLVQVQGRKRVRLAPRVTADSLNVLDNYYLVPSLDEAFGERVFTVELLPGESLFIPVGWFHEVTSLDPSITLSFLSFPWPNHFHWFRPPR